MWRRLQAFHSASFAAATLQRVQRKKDSADLWMNLSNNAAQWGDVAEGTAAE
eukprot:gene11636-33357_t